MEPDPTGEEEQCEQRCNEDQKAEAFHAKRDEVCGAEFIRWQTFSETIRLSGPDGKRSCGAVRYVWGAVDAMVLSGCRTCSSLTNETIHLEGGTRRRGKRNKESKGGESKANCRGTRYGPRDLPSLPQS